MPNEFYARVKCWDTNGKESEWSNVVKIINDSYGALDPSDPTQPPINPPDSGRSGGVTGITIERPVILERGATAFDINELSNLRGIVGNLQAFTFNVSPIFPVVNFGSSTKTIADFDAFMDVAIYITTPEGKIYQPDLLPNVIKETNWGDGGIRSDTYNTWGNKSGWTYLTVPHYFERVPISDSDVSRSFTIPKTKFYFERWAFDSDNSSLGVYTIGVTVIYTIKEKTTDWSVCSMMAKPLNFVYRVTKPARKDSKPGSSYS